MKVEGLNDSELSNVNGGGALEEMNEPADIGGFPSPVIDSLTGGLKPGDGGGGGGAGGGKGVVMRNAATLLDDKHSANPK